MTKIINCEHPNPQVSDPYWRYRGVDKHWFFDCGTEGVADGSGSTNKQAGYIYYPSPGSTFAIKQECTMNTCPFHKDHRK